MIRFITHISMYALFTFCVLLSSCSGRNKQIIIALTEGPAAVSFIHMMDKHQTLGEKEIVYVLKQDPQQIQALMIQQEIDFAVLPTVMAVNLYNKGVAYQLLGIPVWGTLYLLANGNCNELVCLNNSVIHVFGQGSTADILTRSFLKSKGLVNTTINYQFNSNYELAVALLQGNIQYAVISEPLSSQILVLNTQINLMAPVECVAVINQVEENIFAQTAFLAHKRFGERYPELTKQIESLYMESCRLSMSNPDSTAKLLHQHELFTEQIMDISAILRCRINYRKAYEVSEILPLYLSKYLNFDPASIGGKLPDSRFFYQRTP